MQSGKNTQNDLFTQVRDLPSVRGTATSHSASTRRSDYAREPAHDGLTSLPNRMMFGEMLNIAIESARRYQRSFAVLSIALARFKLIDDTLGHEASDELLRQMSSRLRGCLRASDLVARLDGDQFVVLVQEVDDTGEVSAVARKILATVIEPVMLGGLECRVMASVGVSMYPADAQDEQSLMGNADMAMDLAKAEGRNNCQFYSKDMDLLAADRLAGRHRRASLPRK